MNENLEPRVLVIDRDEIAIYDFHHPNHFYKTFYQNRDTRELDRQFNLKGDPFSFGDSLSPPLLAATLYNTLGNIAVERILRHFVLVAHDLGNFFGVLEQELQESIERRYAIGFRERDIEFALHYEDRMHRGISYLKKMSVEGKDVLFPMNLKSA